MGGGGDLAWRMEIEHTLHPAISFAKDSEDGIWRSTAFEKSRSLGTCFLMKYLLVCHR